ncbi:hypothetical protein L2E82_32912 [Cichorium intybus]|uniref:Uncharacterized protein n=1 Tax=Cichorium intybus TaxID=13427 RepID=A0ACB9BIY0_CICIN|nr:hypothetical protein L2E82_32912 [Cichorium intybus]
MGSFVNSFISYCCYIDIFKVKYLNHPFSFSPTLLPLRIWAYSPNRSHISHLPLENSPKTKRIQKARSWEIEREKERVCPLELGPVFEIIKVIRSANFFVAGSSQICDGALVNWISSESVFIANLEMMTVL